MHASLCPCQEDRCELPASGPAGAVNGTAGALPLNRLTQLIENQPGDFRRQRGSDLSRLRFPPTPDYQLQPASSQSLPAAFRPCAVIDLSTSSSENRVSGGAYAQS